MSVAGISLYILLVSAIIIAVGVAAITATVAKRKKKINELPIIISATVVSKRYDYRKGNIGLCH